jgi:hypothetical protein
VKWVGYPLHDATWESARNIKADVPDLVEQESVEFAETWLLKGGASSITILLL